MHEIKMTSDYELFKFREDNRDFINQSHVKRISESIANKNLLHLNPIVVNKEFEVIDGQNRLLAAKMLGVPIYYLQSEDLEVRDIIALNISQSWGQMDYLNYFCKNDYPEYIKLKEFMKKHEISIKVALSITMSNKRDSYFKFREGRYIFDQEDFSNHIEICWETIEYIKRINGYSAYTQSSRFWAALLILIRHANFDRNKWKENLKRMVQRFGPKANQKDYLSMLMDAYNWRNNNKVEVSDA